MAHYQNLYNGGSGAPPAAQTVPGAADWSGEISPLPTAPTTPEAPGRSVTGAGRSMERLSTAEELGRAPMGTLDLRNGLPSEVITDPVSVEEAYQGSLKAMLSRYVGSYIVATFLVGTQNTVSWEGILFDVGNDYLTIYQEARDRYIVSDYYSLKFIEFYDVERRRRCAELLEQDGWRNQE